MKDLIQKLKLIYLPFLITAIGLVISYTFLHWLLILKLELFHINEKVIDFWIPFCLPWIPILLFLRKRIKLLKFSEKARDPHFLYMIVAGIAIAVPSIIAQSYIRTASGQMSKLHSAEQINNSHLTKYYQFNKIYLDKRFAGIYWSVDVSGKHNETMNFHGFFALPIMAVDSDTSKRYFKTWYGIEYRDDISNRLDQYEKELEFQKFQKRIYNEFNSTNLYSLIYFDRIGSNDQHKGLLEAVKVANNYDHSIEPIILKPINEPFENRNGSKFGWIFGSFGIAGSIWLLMILFPSFNELELKKFLSGYKPKPKVKSNYKTIISFLIPNPSNEFFATHIIIELNLLVFLIMVFSGLGVITFRGADLLAWGANYRPNIMNGEYWRLFTSTFLHGGLMHLLMNMYGLFFIGLFLEPILKFKRFALFYVLTGIIASISSVWWHTATVSVGASGAIFGMYGIFLALLLTKLFPKDFQKAFLINTLIFVGYSLLFGLTGGIDNAAHIGGLLSGLLIGFLMYPRLKEEREEHK
jgi:membrane associated rhomboid family serine protease